MVLSFGDQALSSEVNDASFFSAAMDIITAQDMVVIRVGDGHRAVLLRRYRDEGIKLCIKEEGEEPRTRAWKDAEPYDWRSFCRIVMGILGEKAFL